MATRPLHDIGYRIPRQVCLVAAVCDLLPATREPGYLVHRRPDPVQELPGQGDPVDIDIREDHLTWN